MITVYEKMQKKDLIEEIHKLEALLVKVENERRQHKNNHEGLKSEFKSLRSHHDSLLGQLEQLRQSIHVVLQIKYPESINVSPDCNDCDEKRFLIFLHNLCSDHLGPVFDSTHVYR